MPSRGVQNVSNMDSHLALWVFPLFSTIINSTKIFRHLAHQEHPPLVTPFRTRKYKGFSKFIMEKNCRPAFQFFYFKTICLTKLHQWAWLLWSRRFFRHQDRPYWLTSYFNVIFVIRHNMTFYVIWRIWHQNMTWVNIVDLGV